MSLSVLEQEQLTAVEEGCCHIYILHVPATWMRFKDQVRHRVLVGPDVSTPLLALGAISTFTVGVSKRADSSTHISSALHWHCFTETGCPETEVVRNRNKRLSEKAQVTHRSPGSEGGLLT